jgi:hypothetical protein
MTKHTATHLFTRLLHGGTSAYETLRDSDIAALTKVLCRAPENTPGFSREHHDSIVRALIAELPPELKGTSVRRSRSERRRPLTPNPPSPVPPAFRSTSSTLSSSSGSGAGPSTVPAVEPTLCGCHAALDQRLLESVLSWLRFCIAYGIFATCTSGPAPATALPRDGLALLRAAPHLWLHMGDYGREFESVRHRAFRLPAAPAPGLEPQADGCVACVLARIGGCEELLVQIRGPMLLYAAGGEGEVGTRPWCRMRWLTRWMEPCATEAVRWQIEVEKREDVAASTTNRKARIQEKVDEIMIECSTLERDIYTLQHPK